MKREPSPDRDEWGPEEFAAEQKKKGDERFKNQEFRDAIVFYTRGLKHTPFNERLLSNRSASYMKIRKYQLALEDANKAVEHKPEWPKTWFRQGLALRALGRYDMAISSFEEGKSRDKENPDWDKEIERTEEARKEKKAEKG